MGALPWVSPSPCRWNPPHPHRGPALWFPGHSPGLREAPLGGQWSYWGCCWTRWLLAPRVALGASGTALPALAVHAYLKVALRRSAPGAQGTAPPGQAGCERTRQDPCLFRSLLCPQCLAPGLHSHPHLTDGRMRPGVSHSPWPQRPGPESSPFPSQGCSPAWCGVGGAESSRTGR